MLALVEVNSNGLTWRHTLLLLLAAGLLVATGCANVGRTGDSTNNNNLADGNNTNNTNDNATCDGGLCVDECDAGTHDCDANATCTDTAAGYECTCNPGYVGDGVTCAPDGIDECATGTHNCDPNATCTDLAAGFECACNTGYVGDGVTCVSEDEECTLGTHNCDANATCTETAAGFECACNTGYVGDGVLCCAATGGGDATACLQAAIDQVHAAGGGTLQLPNSSMLLISSQLFLRDGVSIDGTTGVIDFDEPTVDTRSTIYSQAEIGMFDVTASNAGLYDLKVARMFDNDVSSSHTMVVIRGGSQHVEFDRITLYGARVSLGIAMWEPNISHISLTNSRIRGALFGFLTTTASAYDWPAVESWTAHASNILIENNEIFTRGDGVAINSPVFNGLRPNTATHTCEYIGGDRASGNPAVGDHDIVIRNNTIVGNYVDETKSGRGFCISLAGAKHVIVEGNELYDCKWQAIHIEDRCYNVLIVDNYMDNIVGPQPAIDESQWPDWRGSVWIANSRGIALVGNEMRGAYDNGVYVMGNSGPNWTCHDTEEGFNRLLLLSGNQVIDPGGYGYSFAGTGDNLNGIQTCFGANNGATSACTEPSWDSYWANNFGGQVYPANTYTPGASSAGGCIIHAGTLGLDTGWAEGQLCQ